MILALKEQFAIRTSRQIRVEDFVIEVDPFEAPGRALWRTGFTEPETRKLLTKLLKPHTVMLDIGAYVGQFSLVASRLVSDVSIFAFEPTPSVFEQLQRNVELNGCQNVVCLNVALSDRPGKANLYTYPESADQNSLRRLNTASTASVEISVETVDCFVKRRKLARLDTIKIDVEGNELAVLRGARESLLRFRPALIVEISRHQRVYGYTGAEIKLLLAELGYNTFRIGDGDYPPYEPSNNEIHLGCSHFNILAVHQTGAVRG